jgi:hypothetical protein
MMRWALKGVARAVSLSIARPRLLLSAMAISCNASAMTW